MSEIRELIDKLGEDYIQTVNVNKDADIAEKCQMILLDQAESAIKSILVKKLEGLLEEECYKVAIHNSAINACINIVKEG